MRREIRNIRCYWPVAFYFAAIAVAPIGWLPPFKWVIGGMVILMNVCYLMDCLTAPIE